MKVPSEADLRRAIAFLATLGLAVATYIAIADANGDAPVCLAGGGGCERVAESSYSELAGVDVAILGIFAYAVLLSTAFLVGDGVRLLGFLTALGGFGFSVYLTYIELFRIEAICEWCVASAVLMTLAFLIAATRLIAYAGNGAAVESTRRGRSDRGGDGRSA
jgi:uncharacterized membrane protein